MVSIISASRNPRRAQDWLLVGNVPSQRSHSVNKRRETAVSSSQERDELVSVAIIRPTEGLRTESSSPKSQLSATVLAQSIPDTIISQVVCYHIYFNETIRYVWKCLLNPINATLQQKLHLNQSKLSVRSKF